MKYYTAHIHPDRAPVLVREGFSWGALLFGPIWLMAHGVWLAAALVAASEATGWLLLPGQSRVFLGLWASWVMGMIGQDLRRWSLLFRGYCYLNVVVARDEAAAVGRLMAARPDLIEADL